MARLFDDASSQYLSAASALRTAAPFSVSAWVYPDTNAVTQGIFALRNSLTTDESFLLYLVGNNALFTARSATVNGTATTANTFTVNAWSHVVAVTSAANSRSVRLNGGTAATDASNLTPSGIDGTRIGFFQSGGSPAYMSGRIADVGLWSVALDADEQTALSKGISPLVIRPASLVGFWPLFGNDSPELDRWKNKFDLTLSGTPTKAEHTRIYMPQGM